MKVSLYSQDDQSTMVCSMVTTPPQWLMPPQSCSVDKRNDNGGRKIYLGSPKSIIQRATTNDYAVKVNTALHEQQQRKRVHFARDAATGKVLCEYQNNIAGVVFDAHDEVAVAVRWYSQLEFRLIKRTAKREAAAFTKAGDQCPYKRQFMKIYDACHTADGLRSIRTADSATLSDTNTRGLESVLFNHSKNRKAIIQAVLAKQEDVLLDILNGDAAAEELPATLALASRTMSQHARRLARVLGSGDAIAAGGETYARAVST